MQHVGLIVNSRKPHAAESLRRVAQLAAAEGLTLHADPATAAAAGGAGIRSCSLDAFNRTVQAVIALGGDGTLLNAAHCIQGTNLPLMGLNIGSLGYLTSVGEERFGEALHSLAADTFLISPRATLASRIVRAAGQVEPVQMDALNDIVVSRGASGRLARIALLLNNDAVTHYMCDGVIVATATGSTAYSLSAGGPIVLPETRCLAISVICPHALGARPLVIPDSMSVTLRVADCHAPLLLSVDGADDFALEVDDRIEIRRSAHDVHVAFLPNHDNYAVLSRKLGWGGRVVKD